ncbi:aspartyl-phosphate phosphatase Spo0E family protein [Neobacillus notoginsengisoli]|uniref:Aspartyl-phosphate phosphatase Spo0E family protein n=1 Tax=Neobacillus notoginsengisoli TaxID=1578198 RepID=A0A417YRR2_9BACI|nr:aspartyl-phosphate phosphatase Spo0E family protein [Neobacillus notoginsengisoli]RHW37969.1 aspartyl-phosphate phosphatase Spo0E family protein [Neobacillus notoginsengisoli]
MLKQDLLSLIEKKRAELIQVASDNGLSSSIAIKYSQELDQLLNQYNQNFVQKVHIH